MRNFRCVSKSHRMWRYVGSYETIPNDRDLMVAVIDGDELHIVEFPCRWREGCWIEANTGGVQLRMFT